MKTINPNIEIFNTLAQAQRYFDKCDKPCHLLKSHFGKAETFFVDKAKEALEAWPNHYTLIAEK